MVTLNKPTAGDVDWTTEINNNWTTIETGLNTGSWKQIATATASSDSTVEFTSGIDSTYKAYAIEIINVIPATDSVQFRMRVSDDGGSTWKSGGSDYQWVVQGLDTAVGRNWADTADSEITLTASINIGSASGEGGHWTIIVPDPAASSIHQLVQSWGVYEQTGGGVVILTGVGQYKAAAAIDGFQFLFSSGNIEASRFELYGIG